MDHAIRHIMQKHPIIPVATLHRLEWALPLVSALSQAGIHILELTLRTDTAWDAISLIKKEFPGFHLGVATALEANHFQRLKELPIDYIGSPAVTASILARAAQCPIPYLPAAATIAEVLGLREQGFDTMKFYPAHIMGQSSALQHFEALFPEVQFCVSGGVGTETALEYLQLPNVLSVAGSWLVLQQDLHQQNWQNIEQKAQKIVASLQHLPKWQVP